MRGNNEAIKQKQTKTKSNKRGEKKMTKVFKNNSKKGFSLVEVICVIAIIVILASVAAFNYFQVFKDAIQALESI